MAVKGVRKETDMVCEMLREETGYEVGENGFVMLMEGLGRGRIVSYHVLQLGILDGALGRLELRCLPT